MSKSPKIVKRENYAAALNVVGTRVTALADNNETNGQEFTYQSGAEGMGPPPHSHAWDESFFVINGTVSITTGGETVICEPGTLAYVPGGTIHSFKYGPGGGEMLEITGEKSRAVGMFTELSKHIPAGSPDKEKIIAVMGGNGATVHL